jgi:hypothetical protein
VLGCGRCARAEWRSSRCPEQCLSHYAVAKPERLTREMNLSSSISVLSIPKHERYTGTKSCGPHGRKSPLASRFERKPSRSLERACSGVLVLSTRTAFDHGGFILGEIWGTDVQRVDGLECAIFAVPVGLDITELYKKLECASLSGEDPTVLTS